MKKTQDKRFFSICFNYSKQIKEKVQKDMNDYQRTELWFKCDYYKDGEIMWNIFTLMNEMKINFKEKFRKLFNWTHYVNDKIYLDVIKFYSIQNSPLK